jgi:hypothetical protein
MNTAIPFAVVVRKTEPTIEIAATITTPNASSSREGSCGRESSRRSPA